MTHREKVDHFIAEVRNRGVGVLTSAPPLYRLLWLVGVAVPPPHFQGFASLALLTGTFFGVFFAGFMYLLQWRGMGMSPGVVCLMALLSGAPFGPFMAGYYRWSARRLKLPPWEQYPPAEPGPTTDRGGK